MIAIILAAGLGNRMLPLTENTHKTLLKIGNVPIINRIIDSLIPYKLSKIYIVTGYKHEELSEHINNTYANLPIQFIYNENYAITNNIYSLSLGLDKIADLDDCILIESDLIYKPEILHNLINNEHDNVALVSKYQNGLDGTVVELDNKKIVNVIPTHLQKQYKNLYHTYKTINIYKFKKDFLEKYKLFLNWYSKTVNDNCYYELILGLLIYMKEVDFYSEVIDIKDWSEVDTPNDLELCEFKFSDKKIEILEKNFGGYWKYPDIIDFYFIRNMHYPSETFLSEMQSQLPHLLQNYGSKFDVVNKKLSYFLLENENNLCVLNGLSQIYPFIKEKYHDKISLIPNPTFGEYLNISDNVVKYQDNIGYKYNEIEKILQFVDNIFVVNPNNPTGTLFDLNKLKNYIKKYSNKLFFIDESFIDFAPENSIVPFIKENECSNVVVLKSLSKVIGMPGLRLGYVYTLNETFLYDLKKYLPIWNNNSIVEYYLEMALKYKIEYKNSILSTIEDRKILFNNLLKIPEITVYETHANYILISINNKHTDFQLKLLNKNIFVKNVTAKFKNPQEQFYRIAVRNKMENKLLCSEIINYFKI
jgi:histidinol-phosphate/aromatic aminotransferase/cobyric acid decarboxylase-like protein/choline kinase